MNKGAFIWADLSTYNTAESIDFYSKVFGWTFSNNEGYYLAEASPFLVAGVYETPPFFKKIKMPHFWMSYFQVDSVKDTVRIAEAQGGKVEIAYTKFNKGHVALIRDPQGAGFTVYEGDALYFDTVQSVGTIIRTELQVSDLQKVWPFYSSIFEWEYSVISSEIYEVISTKDQSNITIREYPNSLKGKYEYWVCTILAKDLNKTSQAITQHGGKIISMEKDRILMTDNTQEAFFYIAAI